VNFFFQTLQGFLDPFDKSELAFMGEVRDTVEFAVQCIELASRIKAGKL
jgi:GAF domain-containing protein